MAIALLNLDALRHNAEQSACCASRWNIAVLPVLKGLCCHPLALRELFTAGFSTFGFTEYAEAALVLSEAPSLCPDIRDRVLFQICPLSKAKDVPRQFGRSFQSSPETLSAVNQAVAESGLRHEVMLVVDMGERREGVNVAELPSLLEHARSLRHLNMTGFALTLGCQGKTLPGADLHRKLRDIWRMFHDKGLPITEVSVGGSVFCRWLDEYGPGLVTEVRLGANFILGTDTYRKRPLPGGPYRDDVCLLQGEVLEISTRTFRADDVPAMPDLDGYPVLSNPVSGERLCALLDIGRVHAKYEELSCLVPGARIIDISSNYTVLDITDCPVPPHTGQHVLFRIGYWSMARLFHSLPVPVAPVRDGSPELQAYFRQAPPEPFPR